MKNTIVYSHLLELVPHNKKELGTTALNLFDNLTLFIIATLIQFGFRDLISLIEY